MLRLFLALRLPPPVLDRVVAWGEEALTSGRRVPREHLHVTLAFLGRRPASEADAIVEELRSTAAACGPIEFVAVRYRETRSVGMIVLDDVTGEAQRLAAALHERLEALGVYRREARRWLPHLTVLRFREAPGLQPSLAGLDPFPPSDAAAFLSRLHPSGARYEVLAAVPLGEESVRREPRGEVPGVTGDDQEMRPGAARGEWRG